VIHIVTDSKTLRQLVLGREQSRGADKVGKALADAIARVVAMARTFDSFTSQTSSQIRSFCAKMMLPITSLVLNPNTRSRQMRIEG
jgi:hypothetical protein